MPPISELKLGVRAASPRDRRTLKAEKYFKGLPPPPEYIDWQSKVPSVQMALNNQLGDCTIAAKVHLMGLWTYYAKGSQRIISDADIIKAYSAVSGYDPVTGANDNGAVMLTVLNYFRQTGIGGNKILAYVELDILDHVQIKQAIQIFGGVDSGVWLPISAQDQIGKVWDVCADTSSRCKIGSWGGHDVAQTKYDKNELLCPTWGNVQRLTWKFWDKYFGEAYAIVTEDWINKERISPSGFDLDTLLQDLEDINGRDPIPPIPPQPPAPNCFQQGLDFLVPRAYQDIVRHYWRGI